MKFDEVEKDFRTLVEFFKQEIPNLREVRVFGGYNTEDWSACTDVDIFVYSKHPDINITRKFIYSKARHLPLNYHWYHYFICNDCSPEMCRVGPRGNLGKDMKNGRLLYKERKILGLIQKLLISLYRE
jgi:hypothetical protein